MHLAWAVVLAAASGTRAAAEPASSSPPRPMRASYDGLEWGPFMLRRAAMEHRLGNVQGVIDALETVDFSARPSFSNADRAAFLLGQAYLEAGSTERFASLARAVSGWKRQSVYTRWLGYQLLLARVEGTAALDSGASAPVNGARQDSLAALVGRGTADALAASLLLAEGDSTGALRLLNRGAPSDSAWAPYVKSVARGALRADGESARGRFAAGDTTTALGRDLAGAAILRQAVQGLARGEDVRALLATVPAGSRYASRARHMWGVAALERGDSAQGRQALEAQWAEDSGYVARREVGLALAGLALDAGDWAAAHRRYQEIDQDWNEQRQMLQRVLAGGDFAGLWSSWETSGSLSDALVLEGWPTSMWADRLASASADLNSLPSLDPPSLTTPPSSIQSRWPIPGPNAQAWRAVAASASRANGAAFELERSKLARARERENLRDRQAYLRGGLARAQAEVDTLRSRVASLDSLARTLAQVDGRLMLARDEAKRRVARRCAEVLAIAERQLLWVRTMRHLYFEGPNRERTMVAPLGFPSPDSLTREEEALTRAIQGYVQHLAAGAPDLIDRSYQHRWRPALIDLATSLDAEAHRSVAFNQTMGPAITASIAASSTSEAARALDARVALLGRQSDSLRSAHQAQRARVARETVERARAALDREREGIDYGLAASAYALSVRLVAIQASDTSRADSEFAIARGALGAGADSSERGRDPADDPEATVWRGQAIASLKAFLEQHPRSSARGEMRFRLADLLLVDARQTFRDRMARFVRAQAEGRASGKAVPVLSQAPALQLYRDILREDRDFPHLDAVLFNAGMLRADEGDREARRFFEELVTRHPRSRYCQEAYLRTGDLPFKEQRFADCIPLYRRAAEGPDTTLRAIALYKMGWAQFNGDHLLEAADAFRSVLDLYGSQRPGTIHVDVEGEAEAYLVQSLARAGGAKAFASYFERIGPRPYERRILRGLGHHFRRYSLFAEAAAAEELYLTRYPGDADALTSAQRLAETYQRWDRPAQARKARLDYAPRFVPGGAWFQAQTSDSLRAAGVEFARQSWKNVAMEHHRDAREHGSREDWREALRLYGVLLSRWPDDPEAPSYELFAGEASARLGDYSSALGHYDAAARTGRDSVASQAMFQRVAVADAWYESTRGSASANRALGRDSLARAVLEAGDQMLARFPSDPGSAGIEWRQGNLAFAHGWFDRAAQDFGRLTKDHPDDDRVPLAASLKADALFRTAHFEEAGAAFEAALAAARRAGRDSLARRAAEAIPLCAYRRAESMATTDSTNHAGTAALFDRVATQWPGYEHAHVARYRAGLAYIQAGEPGEGVRSMESLIREHPKSEYVKDAYLQIAKTWEAAGEKEKAASAYAAFADRYPEDESAGQAWLKAVDLYDAVGRTDRADALRLGYIRKFPADVEAAMEILEGLARRELKGVGPEHPISSLLPPPAPAGKKRKPAVAAKARSHVAEYLGRAEKRPDLASKDLLAQVRFLEGEETRSAYDKARLSQPLDASIPAKQKLLDAVITRYRASAGLGVPQWAHASAYRIGQALVAFGEALEQSERPADLHGDDLRAYEDVLHTQAQAFFVRGEDVWAELLRQKAPSTDDPWIPQARASLWRRLAGRFFFRPEVEYPLVQAEPRDKDGRASRPSGGDSQDVRAQTQREGTGP